MSTAKKVFDFETQLKKGKRGERQFLELFGDLVEESSGGFKEDFKIKASGKTLELKMDLYCPTKTANYFMERWSYKNQDGGVWQSLRKEVDFFCYFFPSCMQFHCFKVKDLVKELDKLTADMYVHNIYNKSHVTQGYVVKRADLEHLELDLEKVLRGKV